MSGEKLTTINVEPSCSGSQLKEALVQILPRSTVVSSLSVGVENVADSSTVGELPLVSGDVISACLSVSLQPWVGEHELKNKYADTYDDVRRWKEETLIVSAEGLCTFVQDWHPCAGPRPHEWDGTCAVDGDGMAITVTWVSMHILPHDSGHGCHEEHPCPPRSRPGRGWNKTETVPPTRYTRKDLGHEHEGVHHSGTWHEFSCAGCTNSNSRCDVCNLKRSKHPYWSCCNSKKLESHCRQPQQHLDLSAPKTAGG